jgi:membrane-bound serine protease (ClpP class)
MINLWLSRLRSSRRLLVIAVVVLASLFLYFPSYSAPDMKTNSIGSAPPPETDTFVIPIQGTIDLGLAYFVKRSLEEAEHKGFDAVILDVDTLGGRVDAALDIRDALEASPLPITAYVNKRAISAGALICLATGRIAMAPGGAIGAATPISIGPLGEASQLSEKEVSYVSGEFRATAERNGHSPLLAEAMVDADTEVLAAVNGTATILAADEVERFRKEHAAAEIKTISTKGKLLTMTSAEAKRVGLAHSTPESLDSLMKSLGLNADRKVTSSSTWSELLVRFLTHPIVSGLLLTFGVLGIFFELQMPGWGISGTLGAVFLALFFGGHYLAGLASVLDVLLFFAGIGLLALELFVIPGFGVAGVSGILCILISVYLALVKRPIPQFSWDFQRTNTVALIFLFALAGIIVGTIVIWKVFPNTRLKKLLVLMETEEAALGYTAGDSLESMVGLSGMSLTSLRPAGKALIAQQPIEVQTLGEFIEKDRAVRVVKVMGNKVFVAEQTSERQPK